MSREAFVRRRVVVACPETFGRGAKQRRALLPGADPAGQVPAATTVRRRIRVGGGRRPR
jgi:hypothetical protein